MPSINVNFILWDEEQFCEGRNTNTNICNSGLHTTASFGIYLEIPTPVPSFIVLVNWHQDHIKFIAFLRWNQC